MIKLTGETLTIEELVRSARGYEEVQLSEDAKKAISHSRSIVDKVIDGGTVVYGISTGFGEFSKIFIDDENRKILQRNLILSHSVGVGEYFPHDIARATMILRANSLAKGYSGIRLATVEKLIELVNKKVTPAIPCKGSVGASGDLAPLSHMASIIFGAGKCLDEDGNVIPAKEALEKAGIEPLPLVSKEGLALINGTQMMTAVGALTVYDAINLFKLADISASLSLEALNGLKDAFDERIAKIRPHKGQLATVDNVNKITKGSVIDKNDTTVRVQDAYSLRCISQIHGASKDALRRAIETIEVEMNSVTDNPIVMPDTGEIISGGNFHGQPVALVMDYIKLAIAELGNVSERRINRLVDPHLSNDLPAFLTSKPGVNSGLMIAQYTAASLVSENKVLTHPASADSIPTSANQEDHVSMGTIAARHAKEVLENVRFVLAIELMSACQGIDFRKANPYQLGEGTDVAYKAVREVVDYIDEDRILADDFNKIYEIIADNSIVSKVESKIGELLIAK